jgi:sirohydrochlorin ferrochelatase
MWSMKCIVVPLIIVATGRVTKDIKNNLTAVSGKHSTDSLQKTAVLGTSHIIRKVLQCEA